jgi:hypothetical protein
MRRIQKPVVQHKKQGNLINNNTTQHSGMYQWLAKETVVPHLGRRGDAAW